MAPINVTTSSSKITAAVSEDKVTANVTTASPISATVTAGFGATGPAGVVNVTAPITNAGTTTAANVGLAVGDGLSVAGGSLRVTPGTYATLVGGKVPADQLPSYVDDVLEYANVASLPATGETGKIYVALNTGRIYRWSGSAYFEISTPPDNTDAVPEGSTNLYFTNARARNAFGTGTNGQVITWSGGDWTAGTVAIASVTGLQTALDGKAASSHTHDASAINAGTLAAARLPLASANTRGAVRIGTGVAIDGDGVISVSVPSLDWASITGKPSTFSPEAHKASHATGGSDALTASDIGAAASSHAHGNITSAGAIGSTSGQIVVTTTGGALTTAASISSAAVSGLATVATSGSYNDLTDKPPTYTRLSDTVSNVSYIGLAPTGSATSASVWRIKKTTVATGGTVSSSVTATNVAWNDRLTASYS